MANVHSCPPKCGGIYKQILCTLYLVSVMFSNLLSSIYACTKYMYTSLTGTQTFPFGMHMNTRTDTHTYTHIQLCIAQHIIAYNDAYDTRILKFKRNYLF